MKRAILAAVTVVAVLSSVASAQFVITDPAAPEPDPDHNSIDPMDLTTVTVSNTLDDIIFSVDFSSLFEGVHIVILLETGYGGSGYGGTSDPFEFPVSYMHDDKPDLVLTYKYTSDDYADLRFWDGEWTWWDDDGRSYRTQAQGWVPGVNIRGSWITKDVTSVDIAIPLYVFDPLVRPDSISVEVYLTQEVVQLETIKRSAFDSAPHDSTLDIDFDWTEPGVDWSITEEPVSLYHYSDRYGIIEVFPDPPVISNAAADPPSVTAGDDVLFTVDVADGGDGIGDVLVDLSSVGGAELQPMADDGTGGDETAGDGTYSWLHTVDSLIPSGQYPVDISAGDASDIVTADTTISFSVAGFEATVRSFADSTGDDHGPDMFGSPGLYYEYPGNAVFFAGAFDLLGCEIVETAKVVAGEIVPSLAFRVRAGDVPDPTTAGAANWGPQFADINIHKVDIYIDAFEGGSTAGLPNRQHGIAGWDAWDYAIVMDGWYKGVIVSGGSNLWQDWMASAHRSDRDIVLATDFDGDLITAVVSKEVLGNPSVEDIESWDIMVVMSGHDGLSTEYNFGDTRWVNGAVSEWQFGGGDDGDHDANVIDILGSPGTGRTAGRDQGYLLDYTSDEALDRILGGETAIVLEMTADITATLLESFSCSGGIEGIEIAWTLSEAGETMEFVVERARDGSDRYVTVEVDIVESAGMTFRVVDRDIEPGARYAYRVYVEDEEGTKLLFETGSVTVETPELSLLQNYPNPFNPATTISFFIPADCDVLLEVFDLSGRRLAVLEDGPKKAGRHDVEWSGQGPGGGAVSSGVYFYRLRAGKETISKKVVLLK